MTRPVSVQRHALVGAHYAFDAMFAARLTCFTQIEEDSGCAIDTVTGFVRRTD
jgi:hypothetical protein